MIVEANAKVNLSLSIVGTRKDGYHDLDMIMVPISLYDTIEIEVLDDEYETLVEMDDYSIPPQNSVTKAIALMKEHFHIEKDFSVYIHKRIPSEAGLGGGSSDAAFVMKAIVQLMKIQTTDEELIELGKKIGADVPFFTKNCPARVQGIGEKITPIEGVRNYKLLLMKPFLGCSTKEIFHLFDQNHLHYDSQVEKAIQALKENNIKDLAIYLQNDLEEPAFSCLEDIKRIKEILKSEGLEVIKMSGSGSTIFALSEDEELLKRIMKKYQQKGYYLQIVSIL